MTSPERLYISRLRAQSVRVSTPRLIVFRALLSLGAVTTSELRSAVECEGVNFTTMYRTLDLFRRLGIIRDFVAGGRKLIELQSDYVGHHHHLSCIACGCLVDFDNADVERSIEAAASAAGFHPQTHQLEITGTCLRCQ